MYTFSPNFQHNVTYHLYYVLKPSVCLSVCLSVGMFPRHGYSFKDTTVWSSPNDSKCLRLGVSVLKISNLPIPEVAFNKNVKISLFFATRLCALIFTMNAHSNQLQGLNFCFFYAKCAWSGRKCDSYILYSHFDLLTTLPDTWCALS